VSAGPEGAPLLAQGLVRSFDLEPAVDGVDLAVGRGQVHALVGLNGAGKSTLMRLLLGMVAPDAGRALVLGQDVTAAPPALWRQVGHLVEAPFAYPELTVRENLCAAGRLHGLEPAAAREAADRLLGDLALDPWADRRSRVLSLGNRQRLGLACALVHRPAVVVLDEPTNAMDPAGVLLVRRLLEVEAGRGAAVLVSSHHLDEVARIADRISVLHRGRVIGVLDPSGVDLERAFFATVYADEAARTGAAT